MQSLEKELETYNGLLPNLLENQGRFVLIKGNDVAGIWDTYKDAIQEGYRLFGLEPFLVKQIQAPGFTQNVTRHITPICQS